MRIVICPDKGTVGDSVCEHIIEQIRAFAPTKERPFVLGLPTGSTPLPTYQRLIQAYREGRVTFRHVVTFNMDEYVGLPREHPQSYYHFMKVNFFDFVDIPEENRNLLDGTVPDLIEECRRYEEKIKNLGGIHLFLAGVGTDGHLAFNEPGSSLDSVTRVKSLNEETIVSNARFFDDNVGKVPTMALTVGIRTIMQANSVILIATGLKKAAAVAQCVEGHISNGHPVTILQMHPYSSLYIDEDATNELRVKTVRYFKGLLKREDEMRNRQMNAKHTASKL